MAYPYGSLATGKTDATNLQTDHPAHHNATAAALNDLLVALGSNPMGASDVTARLAALEAAPPPPTALTITATKTISYALSADEFVPVDSSAGALTLTLPTAPADGTQAGCVIISGGNTVTVARGGADLIGKPTTGVTSRTLNVMGQSMILQYESSVAVWFVLSDADPVLDDGNYTELNTATAGRVKVNFKDEIGAQTVKLLGGGNKLIAADFMTTGALPSCTYANGSSGIGATLTATANGALADQDGQTPVAGDLLLVVHQASQLQNGLYRVTQVGTGGTPFILTREITADTAADLADGLEVFVSKGIHRAGSRATIKSGTYTMGTTPVIVQSGLSVGDVLYGPGRDRQNLNEEFDSFTGTFTPGVGVHVPGIHGYLWGAGGAGTAMTQIDIGTEAVQGCADLATGTTTTGNVLFALNAIGITFDVNKRWEMYIRVKVPLVSDGVETFNVKLGWFSGTDGLPTDGVYFEARSGTANWIAVTTQASTPTETDTGIAYGTTFRNFNIIVPGDGHAYFYNAGLQIADNSTNMPSALTLAACAINKSAGTTSRSLRLDYFATDMPRTPTNFLTP